MKRVSIVVAVVLLSALIGACSDDEDGATGEPVEAPEQSSLALASERGCVIDDDCAEDYFCFQRTCARVCEDDDDCPDGTCSSRGRCVDSEGEEEVVGTLTGVTIEEYPDSSRYVESDDTSVSFTFGVDGELPPEGIAYRVWRSDGESDESRVRHAQGGDSFTVTLPVGDASPEADNPREVAVTLFTALGDIDLLLAPEPSFEGVWEGQVEVEEFGNQAFPLEVHLLGDEPEEMQVAIPVRQSSLFSPHAEFGDEDDYIVLDLVHRPHLNAYQAISEQAYDFESGLFAALDEGQVKRTLRFDFDDDELEEGIVQGRFSDRWHGLFNMQRSDGELNQGQLEYSGDFHLLRSGSLPLEHSDYEVDADGPEANPGFVERQPVGQCSASMLDVEPVDFGDDEVWHCDAISTLEEFEEADAEDRALCALAVARGIDDAETTSDQLASYFAEDGGDVGLSFEGFLQACADDEDQVCQPAEQAGCTFELIAYAARDIDEDHFEDEFPRMRELRNELMGEFVEASREAFLARQLGAFYTDMEMRREWLRQSSAPTVFLDAVEEANQELMDDWQEQVLDVHHELFVDMFIPNAVTFMSRPADVSELNEMRRSLLQESSTLWRSYAEALLLGAQRWDEILHTDAERAERVEFLQARATELYLTMGILMEFNRAANAGAQSALLASDFAALIEAIEKLDQSFDDALFARDAEVVTARSLDPLSDNESLLSERRQQALDAVDVAMEGINEILDDVTIEALQEQEMRNRLQNDRRDAANAVARLCGLPRGCTEDDLLTDPECVDVELGSCGLLDPGGPDEEVAFDPERVAASEAGSAALEVLEAFQNVAIQRDELEGHLQKLDLELQELNAFKRDVERWNMMRLEGVSQLEQNLAQRQTIRDDRIEDMLDNIEQRASIRQEQIEDMNERFNEWNQMRIDSAYSSFSENLELLSLRHDAEHLEMTGSQAATAIDAAAKALPKVTGTSVDSTSVARAGLWLSARAVEFGTERKAMNMEHNAQHIENMSERDSALSAANVARMEEQAELDEAIAQAEIDALRDEMMVNDQLADDEIEQLREAIELMEAQLEAELAYERDMAEFRQRRTEHLKNHVETSGRHLRLERSRFNVLQRTAEYNAIVNEARLEAARLNDLDQQLINLDNLVGGMGAIFSQSHQLNRTERHLQQARNALMDWLVVLEYYAVRPFFSQRIQIMLARNAYQLEAIAEDLQNLEQTCGGSERSSEVATLSLREDVLGLTRSVESAATGEEIDPEERFRRWLAESHVPVDRRIRWSTSQSLSSVLERTEGVLASTFQLRLDQFANLPLACNGKIESIALNVVGDVGDIRPIVSLLYDGTSQLRSCQPNIDEYVEAFGQGMTSYGTITHLRTEGRSMSPLAGVNEFPSETSVNRTLAGLPVASEYTLLIDTEVGDNEDVDWDGLEDIEIEVQYSYQDLFATSCD